MRKLALVLAALGILVLTVALYPHYVPKPEKDGAGPLAVLISARYAAPEYHSPLEWWQTHHMDVVNRADFAKQDCLYCHEPETSCNNCHGFVGALPVEQVTQPELTYR